MVMGAYVDRNGMKRGAWSKDEDKKLRSYILKNGGVPTNRTSWRLLPPAAGLKRCGKSCRLRWMNYLKPGLKHGNFTPQEQDLILKLRSIHGNKWSLIAANLPGRTDNEVKNHWHAHLKKMKKSHAVSSSETLIPPSPVINQLIMDAAGIVPNAEFKMITADHLTELLSFCNITEPEGGNHRPPKDRLIAFTPQLKADDREVVFGHGNNYGHCNQEETDPKMSCDLSMMIDGSTTTSLDQSFSSSLSFYSGISWTSTDSQLSDSAVITNTQLSHQISDFDYEHPPDVLSSKTTAAGDQFGDILDYELVELCPESTINTATTGTGFDHVISNTTTNYGGCGGGDDQVGGILEYELLDYYRGDDLEMYLESTVNTATTGTGFDHVFSSTATGGSGGGGSDEVGGISMYEFLEYYCNGDL